MKTLLITLVLFCLLFTTSCKKGGCIEHEKWACELIDINPNYYDPVCDCEGNTYQNEWVIQCLEGKTKYKKGKCK
ncbi:MAG: hypothetical protein WCG64_03205 [Flavobacteriia bacterium]